MASGDLPNSVDALLQKLESDVLSVEQIGSMCDQITKYLQSKDETTLSQLELQSVLLFITAATANHESFALEVFHQLVLKFYQVCSDLYQSEAVKCLNAQISSLSLSLLTTVMEKGSLVFLEPLISFHSLLDSKESQQFLEILAVKMPKQFVSHLLKFTGESLNVQMETPVEKMREVSALIAPTAMLIVSKYVFLLFLLGERNVLKSSSHCGNVLESSSHCGYVLESSSHCGNVLKSSSHCGNVLESSSHCGMKFNQRKVNNQ